MRHIHTATHPELGPLSEYRIIQRQAARAIVVDGEDILMLYTARYHDYTLPGGGVDAHEDILQGLVRELEEETGAKNIHHIQPYGIYEEFRPWYRDDAEVMHMISHCFTCKIDRVLGETRFEDYEVKNGMKPVWININDAIRHNEKTMTESDKKGMSVERETFLLRLIARELL
ncbi:MULTISPECIES: NUDIX hydrolase [Vibrio]|uniref:NUDIX domain-containing protein n=1 Tax=Vibrio ostreae TaxID=2841925 RepID=A0A975U8L0_9VIBR|nr:MULTISPECIES: NUDIX hydrolase [Vibrio]QXO16316.1 NUDIX domain-containing protein [Vibrio ostreae]WGY45159.1 NUDIX domain-containing protein [Vibrio sp. ABG19]